MDKEFTDAYKREGAPSLIITPGGEFVGRFIGMTLIFLTNMMILERK